MTKPKALITSSYSAEELDKLKQKFDVTYLNWMDRGKAFTEDELIELVADKEIVIVEVCELKSRVVQAAKKLKLVGCSRGLRGDDGTIDTEALTQRGIPILYAPGRNLNAVAEYTILMTLAAMKKVRASTKWLYDNQWKSWLDFYLTFRTSELDGKKVGLLGFGNIGKRVSKLYQAFGAEVGAYDPFITDENVYRQFNVKMESLDAILQKSDVVSLHMNVSSENKGFLDAERISQMKPSAFLINSARAVLVDHDALYQALKDHKIAGAAIDVFYNEPSTTLNEPLLSLDNVFATPHMAGTTEEVIKNHSQIINAGIEDLLQGKTPQFVLNAGTLSKKEGIRFD